MLAVKCKKMLKTDPLRQLAAATPRTVVPRSGPSDKILTICFDERTTTDVARALPRPLLRRVGAAELKSVPQKEKKQ